MEVEKGGGGGSSLVPVVPPFLSKCYEMVEDPQTNGTVSWSETNNSFVIWDPATFCRDLLPKYFKHSNLSSFVRQLNTYGFRKVDPDRYEFANEGFLRGQKDLLKTITRKKPSHNAVQQHQSQGRNTSVKACVEVGKFGPKEEIEMLKRDKNVLMQELVKLRQHQQNTDHEVRILRQRIQGMEQHQQQMMSFLAMAVKSPGFVAQLMQQTGNNRWTEANKKRRLPALEQGAVGSFQTSSDGQIIRYQPFMPETLRPSMSSMPNSVVSPNFQPMSNGVNDLSTDVDVMSLEANSSLPPGGDIPLTEYIEQLLASPISENHGQMEPESLEVPDFMLDFVLPEQEIQMETSKNMVLPSEQMGGNHQASEKADRHTFPFEAKPCNTANAGPKSPDEKGGGLMLC
ncbi:heat stress transcription factor A-1-like isoform X2 [Phoenix dactylifera]|uniref:Heat stress transcription factor A-1-like isoform X2 n=1 Tax=Phoenix dactylifera TaxID=42345 RepID=A0A8B9AKN2_PHODC|nr:heat stress transcription factor A-1-like isoform X2 [Phoenix dactylifera]